MRQRGKDAQGGFSLIEIMVAVTVFTLAVSAIMSMLLTSMRANASAGEGTQAIGIAERFLERFKVQQLGWKGVGDLSTEACQLAIEQGTWSLPLAGSCASGSPWSDGRAHDADGLNVRKSIYCLHYRTRWLPDATHATPGVGDTASVMVTVRVAYTADGSESWRNCQPATVDAALAAGGNARAVVLPTILTRRPK